MIPRSLSILVPCFNEELCIAGVVTEYKAAFPDAEIVVVNNASQDRTREVALAAGATVIDEPRKGKARAILTALEQIQTDVVIMVDGDGSYPAAGAQKLFECYLRHPVDLVTGVRSAETEAKLAFRPMHQAGTQFFALSTFLIFRYFPKDIFSGLRLFSKRFYKNVPILCTGFELEMELTVQAVDKGFSTDEVETPFRARSSGTTSKLRTFRDGFRILFSLIILFRDYKPQYFFGAVSLLFFLAGLLAGSIPIRDYYTTHLVAHFPLAILAAALMNIAMFTLLAGLVAETNLRYHREFFQINIRRFHSK